MPFGGYDIKLGTLRLRLTRTAGAPTLRYVSTPYEPTERFGVETIEFDNFHHGIGPDVFETPDHVRWTFVGPNQSVITANPGRVENAGLRTLLLTDGVADIGPTERFNGCSVIYACAFRFGNDVFMLLPRKLIKIAAGGTSGASLTVTGLGGAQYMVGPPAWWRDKFYWGLVDTSGTSVGHVEFDPTAGTATAFSTAGAFSASMFRTKGGELWALQVPPFFVSSSSPQQAMWRMFTTHASVPEKETAWRPLTTERWSPFPIALNEIGDTLLLFGGEGEVVAISERGELRSLVKGATPAFDRGFGAGAQRWDDLLLVPSERALFAMSGGGDLRDISPAVVQGTLNRGPKPATALAAYGDKMFVGTAPEADNSTIRHLLLGRYSEGLSYTYVSAQFAAGPPARTPRALMVLPNGRAYMLYGNAVDGGIDYMDLPIPTGGAPLSGSSAAEMQSSFTFGPNRGRKIFLGVRGWLEQALSGGASANVLLAVDNGAGQLVAAPTAAGPFSDNQVRPTGETISVILRPRCTTPASQGWPVFLGKIYVDFMEEPTAGQRIEFVVDGRAYGGFARAGRQTAERMSLFATLKALEGQTLTLEILGSSGTFSVYVEEVAGADRSAGTGRERAYNSIRVRVVVL